MANLWTMTVFGPQRRPNATVAKKLAVLYPTRGTQEQCCGERDLHDQRRLFIAVELAPAVQSSLARACEALRQSSAFAQCGPQATRLVRWVPPRNMHITLCFIGSVDSEKIPSLLAELQRRITRLCVPCFELRLGSQGTFRSAGLPRVLWQGLKLGGDAELFLPQLAAAARRACVEIGVLDGTAKKESFAAHVTLARVKAPQTRRRKAIRQTEGGSSSVDAAQDGGADPITTPQTSGKNHDETSLKSKLKQLEHWFMARSQADLFGSEGPFPMIVRHVSLMQSCLGGSDGPMYTRVARVDLG